MNQTQSRDLYDRALSVIPGGVNSSVRAIQPFPSFIQHGDGAHVVDADGNRYLDYVMGYGPLLFGHALPEPVEAAIQSRITEGPLFGMPTEIEVELAEFIVRHVPSVDQVRFVNSGTEATISAVRLARGYTGRDDIVVMKGGYHGAQESTLVEGDHRETQPSTRGIPQAFAEHTIPVPFNDIQAVQTVLEDRDVAAVLTEPLLANTGIVEPEPGYHEALRDLCTDHQTLLMFDEVITGFRVGGLGCAQSRYDIEPDITTFGKIIGGGFPVGAIGGRADILSSFTPAGDIFQSGTFSGHPVTMAAGLETLRFAAEHDTFTELAERGDRLRDGLSEIVAQHAPAYTVVGTDSLFKVIFTRHGESVRTGADVEAAQTDRWDRLFRPAMQEEGILLSANQKEANFLSAAHTEADIEDTLAAYEKAL